MGMGKGRNLVLEKLLLVFVHVLAFSPVAPLPRCFIEAWTGVPGLEGRTTGGSFGDVVVGGRCGLVGESRSRGKDGRSPREEEERDHSDRELLLEC
jgi:hypothetical protein